MRPPSASTFWGLVVLAGAVRAPMDGGANNILSDRPIRAWVIDAGYQVASLSIMAAVLGSWR